MNDPRRWLDEGSGASSLERDLLRGGALNDPPAGAKDAVWASIAASVAAAGVVTAAASTAAASTAASASVASAASAGSASLVTASGAAPLAKAAVGAVAATAGSAAIAKGGVAAAGGGLVLSAILGAGSAVVVVTTFSVVAPREPAREPAARLVDLPPRPRVPRAESRQGSRVYPGATEAAVAVPSASASAPSRAPSAKPALPPIEPVLNDPLSNEVTPRASELAEESRGVGEARALLRSGDAAGALARLDRLRRDIAGGGLGQEREALAIEALARSGRRAEAVARARQFLQANPSSPFAVRIRPFAQ